MKLKEAMQKAKSTGKSQKVSETTKATELKVTISIRLDQDVLLGLKQEAAHQGLPYQTLMNSILKRHLNSQDLESRLEIIEKKLKISAG